MKACKVSRFVMALLGLGLLSGLGAPPTHADFTFGTPMNLGPAINSATGEWASHLSADGLEFYFTRANENAVRFDIWVARRATLDDEWEPAVSIGVPINSADNGEPFLTADGLTLLFSGNRPGTCGTTDLWISTRVTKGGNWGAPVNLGATVNSSAEEWGASLSADELELYFTSNRPGGSGNYDLWMTTRASVNDSWRAPTNLGPLLNTPYAEAFPSISPDGLVLFFASTQPGVSGGMDLFMTRRATTTAPWDPPTNLGPAVNSNAIDNGTKVSADGSVLFFFSTRPGGSGSGDIWQAPIVPIVDFNGDGNVDAADMDLLVANWGRSEPLCDIGPSALGDGIVDEKDLKVLMESLMTPDSTASDVPCNIVLSWMGPSFAQAYDVYLGTSFDDINKAMRDDPCGVLVSLEQPETTYMPEDILELDQTYYWRVDTVVDSTAGVIYRGPVVTFTTEVSGHRIRSITATASSSQPGMGPEKTVDGSGLDAGDGHSTTPADMWTSRGVTPNWITYEFDGVCVLHELWVWNSNQAIEPFLGFGAKSVTIEYSIDGTTWATLDGVPEFARAPGKPGYVANTKVSFSGVSAQFVRLTIDSTWGAVAMNTGLSEVRFFYIPVRPYAPVP